MSGFGVALGDAPPVPDSRWVTLLPVGRRSVGHIGGFHGHGQDPSVAPGISESLFDARHARAAACPVAPGHQIPDT